MTLNDVREINFSIGDKVIVTDGVRHKNGVVVGFYPRFFNVEFEEGFQRSISYFDKDTVKKGVIIC